MGFTHIHIIEVLGLHLIQYVGARQDPIQVNQIEMQLLAF